MPPFNARGEKQNLGKILGKPPGGKERSYGGGAKAKRLSKRHGKSVRETIMGITKPAIRRLARRGGVKRLSGLIYDEARHVMKMFLE